MNLFLIIVSIFFINDSTIADTSKPGLFSKLDDDLREIVEGIKTEMPNGFPEYGIPPLVPYERDHSVVNVTKDNLVILGNFTQLVISGLNEFYVVVLHFNPITQKFNFEFNFTNLEMLSYYQANVWFKFTGLMRHIYGSGIWYLRFIDLRFKGSFRLVPHFNGMKIGSFECEASLGSVKSGITGIMNNLRLTILLNRWIEEFLVMAVNDNAEVISEDIKNAIVPLSNQYLDKYTLAEILAFILGKQ